jgi:hypothetical protein
MSWPFWQTHLPRATHRYTWKWPAVFVWKFGRGSASQGIPALVRHNYLKRHREGNVGVVMICAYKDPNAGNFHFNTALWAKSREASLQHRPTAAQEFAGSCV